MTAFPTSTPGEGSQETESYDSVMGQFLRKLDQVRDGPGVAALLAEAIALHTERAGELRELAEGYQRLLSLREPERLGPYRIRRLLATGGMGKLYEAEEEALARFVAIKTIKSGPAADSELISRFERERRTLALLHHTNIVPIYSTGQQDGLLYFSMPRLYGPSLRTLIRTALAKTSTPHPPSSTSSFDEILSVAAADEAKEHASHAIGADEPNRSLDGDGDAAANDPATTLHLPPDYRRRVAAMLAEVAEAVHHAHQAGVIHRDLKPANILVEPQGHPWVLDFGLAHLKGDRDAAPTPTGPDGSAALAGPTVGVGTPLYMAPEQLHRSEAGGNSAPSTPIDQRTDVWGLGVTLYELLTLRRPFSNSKQIASEPPPPPCRLVATFPSELEAVCLKALAKDPNDRYQSAQLLADDLRRWLRGEPTVAGAAGPIRRVGMWARRKPTWAALLALGIFGLLTFSYGAVHVSDVHRERAEAESQASKREAALLGIQRLLRPTRDMGWFNHAWTVARSMRGGRTSADPELQGYAAAALEGVDARVVKTFPGEARRVMLDPGAARLLMLRSKTDPQGESRFRTSLWDRGADRTLVERDLGDGALAFLADGTPLQLSRVEGEPPFRRFCTRLKLFDVASGRVLQDYAPSLEVPSHIQSTAMSRDGSRVAAVTVPIRRDGDGFAATGEETTIIAWDANTGQQVLDRKHQDTQDLVLSPDGRLVAAWSSAGEIQVWTLPDGKDLPPFRVGRMPVSCLAFGRDPVWQGDGSMPPWLLAVAESSGLITVWDLRTHRPRAFCRGSAYQVRAMDFRADGAVLLSAGRNPAKLWDVATGSCILNLAVGNTLDAVDFAPEGRHIVVGKSSTFAPQGAVEVLELERGHGIHTLYGLQGIVEKTITSPDGRLVAGISHEWQVGIWEWPSGSLRAVLPVPVGRYVDSFGMAFDADGRRFAYSAGTRAEMWDLRVGRRLKQWTLPGGLCENLGFPSPDRLLLVRAEARGMRGARHDPLRPDPLPWVVPVYDLLGPTPEDPLAEIRDFPCGVQGLRLSPDWSVFLVEGHAIDDDRKIRRTRLYEASSGRLLSEMPTERYVGGSSLAFIDPRGKALAVDLSPPGAAQRLSLFDLPALRYRGAIDWPVNALNLDAEQWLAELGVEGGRPRRFVLHGLGREGPLLQVVRDVGSSAEAVRFSPDGRHVIAGNSDGTISVLDLAEMNQRLSELRLGW